MSVLVATAATANIRLAGIIAVASVLIFIPPLVRDRREAIVLSDRELFYTSGNGKTTCINIAEIHTIEETYVVALPLYAEATTVPAIRLELRSGETKTIPLAFPDRREIVSRVRQMTELFADHSPTPPV